MNSPLNFRDPTGLQVAQRFCINCTPTFDENGVLRVYVGGETAPDNVTRVSGPMVFEGLSGRIYSLTPSSSLPYQNPNDPAVRWEAENNPKTLAARNQGVRDAGADVIGGFTAFSVNSVTGTYNLGASGANYFGSSLPFAPTVEPTTPGMKMFYYGATAGSITQGGVSLYNGARNYFASGGSSIVNSPVRALLGTGQEANAGGVIRSFITKEDQVFFRVSSGIKPQGSFLTAVPPRSSVYAQEALSLPSGNNASFIQEVLVPAGTRLQRSRALPVPSWGRFRGGGEQFELLEHIPKRNFGPFRTLRGNQ